MFFYDWLISRKANNNFSKNFLFRKKFFVFHFSFFIFHFWPRAKKTLFFHFGIPAGKSPKWYSRKKFLFLFFSFFIFSLWKPCDLKRFWRKKLFWPKLFSLPKKFFWKSFSFFIFHFWPEAKKTYFFISRKKFFKNFFSPDFFTSRIGRKTKLFWIALYSNQPRKS